MNRLKSFFVFFVLCVSVYGAEGSWEDSWGSLNETESIDSGDIAKVI